MTALCQQKKGIFRINKLLFESDNVGVNRCVAQLPAHGKDLTFVVVLVRDDMRE